MIECEIKKGIHHASTASMRSTSRGARKMSDVVQESVEALTIQDYQSIMDSKLPTDALNTKRDHFTENNSIEQPFKKVSP